MCQNTIGVIVSQLFTTQWAGTSIECVSIWVTLGTISFLVRGLCVQYLK